ncbi:MAG: enoyl-CoA hydratase/isomerase family protein [Alphaproteobacteria bacterium]
MPTEPVLVEQRDEIRIVTLNRPEALNAVDAGLRDGLIAALAAAEADRAVKAVVLTGAGGRAFSAGQDFSVSTTLSPATAPAWMESLHGFYQSVRALSKPAVAAIDGVAAGAGFQAALWCDLRVGTPKTRMGQPEVAAGMASVIGVVPMLQALGLSRTLALSLTSRLLDAEACLATGLLTEIAPADGLMDRAIALARKMTAMPPIAFALTKRRIAEVTQPAFDDAIRTAADFAARSYAAGEPQAAAAAFNARKGRPA